MSTKPMDTIKKSIKELTAKRKKTITHKTRKQKSSSSSGSPSLSDKENTIILKNKTPGEVRVVSRDIMKEAPKEQQPIPKSVYIPDNQDIEDQGSYSPTINRDLIQLQSLSRESVGDCNNKKAFELKEPLAIEIKNNDNSKTKNIMGKMCHPYDSPEAIQFLLKNLQANKHVQISKVVPPIQSQSNCWFNTMFVTLFVSDKGRKFFHFFRQMMIEGTNANGEPIPQKLKNGFALLNYAIDACLTGNEYAYTLDTNAIIRSLYKELPEKFKSDMPYITDIDEAGNPLRYYDGIMKYLNNKSIVFTIVSNVNNEWRTKVEIAIAKQTQKQLPHVIVLEIYDGTNGSAGISGQMNNRPTTFTLRGATYKLDSATIRDTSQQHFCAVLTCENKEYAYDGMSFHRLTPLQWKSKINNASFEWAFDTDKNPPLKWSFRHGYQMLVYYRVK